MKATFKLLGIVAIAMVIGFSMAACDDDPTPTPTYTVTFNSNGGGTVAPITVESGKKISRPSNPKKSTDVFNGWYRDDSTFKDKWNFNTDTVTGNTTLYADWLSLSGINEADFGSGATINTVFDVATAAEWDAAVSAISGGGDNKNYIINIIDNFSISGYGVLGYTFERVSGVKVSIRGEGMTMSLSGSRNQGVMLNTIDNQTVILWNVTLQGRKENTAELVSLTSSNFIMNGGEISGNGRNGVLVNEGTFDMNDGKISGNKRGVFVMGGTFTMNGGEISGNTTEEAGGGVYITHRMTYGRFTMNGGEIFGNTAPDGGGVYLASSGVFRISNGVIYGSNADGNLKNTATSGAAAFSKNDGATAERGTFTGTGGSWLKTDDLPTTDNTIRVVDGTLWQ
jgi:uncharacterized repeat protein (TIGR02543 family)